MATKKKKEEVIDTEEPIVEANSVDNQEVMTEEVAIVGEKEIKERPVAATKSKKEPSVPAPGPKFPIGSIVFVSRDADTDLEGFKLFPQYKKYAYTVEAYDDNTGVYTLRRLNLSLKLKEAEILAPSERAHDTLNRVQY